MGNNNEIRKRMETYRDVLLALVWIGAIIGMIGGLGMIIYETNDYYSSSPLRPFGVVLLILSIFGGIIGHFLVNVGLAIPFILLNNGDILESMKKKEIDNVNSNDDSINVSQKIEEKENIQSEVKYTVEEKNKNAEIELLEKQFESSTDENKKGVIAKKLYDLGKTYYWRFIPKEKK
jgi:hypothetical protein